MHTQSKLGVVEPSVVSVHLLIVVFILFVFLCQRRVGPSSTVAFPLTGDRELLPGRWENLTHVHLIVVGTPVFIAHPPCTVISECIVKFFFETFMVVPSLIFIGELTSPLAMTPRVPNSNQLKTVNVPDIHYAIGMIKQNA